MHGDGRLLPPRLPVPGLAKPQNNVPWSSLALRQPIVPKNRAAKKNSRSPLRKRRRRAIAPIGNARRAAQAEPPFLLSLCKVRMVKDPDTGRRVSRPNPKDEWQSSDVPELAIVNRELTEPLCT